jgi:hypothetical protein
MNISLDASHHWNVSLNAARAVAFVEFFGSPSGQLPAFSLCSG